MFAGVYHFRHLRQPRYLQPGGGRELLRFDLPALAHRGLNLSTDAGPGEPGSVLSGTLVLDGNQFMGINGGPHFTFSEAVSFTINRRDQDEVDYYWNRLTDGARKRHAAGARTGSA